jgi:hypothetical protein
MMVFTGISYVAVVAAAVAAYVFGAAWYMFLAKPWLAAVGFAEPPKPEPAPFVIAFVAQLVIAYFLAGLIAHLGEVTVLNGLITAFFVWLPFVMGTMIVNHRFQGSRWSLTLIDGGHWLGVFLVMGLVVGLMGA